MFKVVCKRVIIVFFDFDDDKPKKTKRVRFDKNIRHAVWAKYIGEKTEGKCYCCGSRTIHITDFQVGHNKAIAKGGKNQISNLRPICGPCNRGMGTTTLESYKKKHFSKTDSTTSKSKTTKSAKPISKKDLLNKLSKTKLKKVVKILDLDYDEYWDGDEKEDYIEFLSSSRKATVKRIQDIVE